MNKKILSAFLTFAIAIALLPVTALNYAFASDAKTLDVLFTHDLHSHFESFNWTENGVQSEVGGLARMKTLINEQKEKNPDTLMLDAGDFSMGTLIQSVYETQAAELRMLGFLCFDATTLGNHEFDYNSDGISGMMNAAVASGETLPAMVVSNIDWDKMEANGLTDNQKMIKEAFDNYGVKDYIVVQKGDVKIAVFGIFGKESLDDSPTCELLFKDQTEAARETVSKIKANEDVDMIACVSHSGTSEDESKSEDQILAKNVGDIDLIVSGHTHTTLNTPITVGNTTIVSCGEYGRNLGSVSLKQNDSGRWDVSNYKLIAVSENVADDEATSDKISSLMTQVDKNYLSNFGYSSDQVLATNNIKFDTVDDVYNNHTESNLGDLMSDAFRTEAERATGETVDITIAPAGTIRGSLPTGNITVADAYNSYSLGSGNDGLSGFPLLSLYFTGKEVKTAAEIDASLSDLLNVARLYSSGLNFTYNPNRMILNRVTDVYLTDVNGNRVEVEDDKLYHVVTDLYTGQMMNSVLSTSYGLLSVTPKDKDGNVVTNLESQAIMDGNKQLKAWAAIAKYVESFDDTDGDGIANVSDYYSTWHDRKVVDNSTNFFDLVKNPNQFFFGIIGILLGLVVVIVLIVVLIVKLTKRHKRKKLAAKTAENAAGPETECPSGEPHTDSNCNSNEPQE